MPRRGLGDTPGATYHIYNRGANRGLIFFEDGNYTFFLERLRHYLEPDQGTLLAYCLMPNHFHLILNFDAGGPSPILHRLGVSYAKAINRSLGRTGPLFEGRFGARAVSADSDLLHLSRYVHLNPVIAGLTKAPLDWLYSSYSEFLGQNQTPICEPYAVLGQFHQDLTRARKVYRSFVEDIPPDPQQAERYLSPERNRVS
jgi:REP element-mobilizing transposase RayT